MQAICVFRLVVVIGVLIASSDLRAARGAASNRGKSAGGSASTTLASRRSAKISASGNCKPCGEVAAARTRGRSVKKPPAPCHPPDYVDPSVKRDLNAALRDMRRAGVTPKITSAWRSSDDQGRMYKCSSSRRCRTTHPGLFRAMPPGQSAHEAGLALDISGVATGPRGAKHLTPQGRQIVRIMENHGFDWKYGLADPVHFEADPKEHGYRSLKQAIHVTQTRCQARILAKAAAGHTRGAEKRAVPAKFDARNRVAQRRKA